MYQIYVRTTIESFHKLELFILQVTLKFCLCFEGQIQAMSDCKNIVLHVKYGCDDFDDSMQVFWTNLYSENQGQSSAYGEMPVYSGGTNTS